MTDIAQINNDQIRTLAEQQIEGKKDVYFYVTAGEYNENTLHSIHELTDKCSGSKEFLRVLEIAFNENPHYIGIALYKKAKKNFQKKHFYFNKFQLKQMPKNETLGGLEMFGGLEGVMETKFSAKYLSDANERLKEELRNVKEEKKDLSLRLGELTKTNSELSEDIKETKWEHRTKLADLKRNSGRIEKLIELGGVIVAKASGLDANGVKNLLGMEDDKKSLETGDTSSNHSNENIDFEQVEDDFLGKKADAKQLINSINQYLISTLKANKEQTAYEIIASYMNIINFSRSDFNNLQMLHQFVIKKTEELNNQSPADRVLKQAEKYEHKA